VLLEAANLRFAYRGGPQIIDDVSFGIEERGLVSILGPNGSGKTTILRLIARALRPTSGHVRLGGVPIETVPRRVLARRLAVVPQETVLAFDYSVIEIVLMGRYPHLGVFEVEGPDDFGAATSALEATGTAELAGRPFRTLSGGEKQLEDGQDAVAPPLLLLDEPTASLDLRYQLDVASLLRRLHDRRHVTIVLTTHDLRFAASVCTRVILLSKGRVLSDGAPADVLTASQIATLYELDAEMLTTSGFISWDKTSGVISAEDRSRK
jgi:ABC-type cobalamin/Fe3+-siderophores transport system ATPase subunit